MKNQLKLVVLFTFFFATKVFTQCPPPWIPEPTMFCEEAQIQVACDGLDGLCGILEPTFFGPMPFPSCFDNTLDNPEWYAFVAGSSTIQFLITPFNCSGTPQGFGLQAAIYEDCQNPFPLAMQCDASVNPFELFSNFFISGKTYYLVIDGWAGDICDYQVDILSGSTFPNIPPPAGGIDGQTEVCMGTFFPYTVTDPVLGLAYAFSVSPVASTSFSTSSISTEIQFNTSGVKTVCAYPIVDCVDFDDLPATCITVNVEPPPPPVFVEIEYCVGVCVEFAGELFCTPGPHQANFVNYLGCDSIVNIILIPIPPAISQIEIFICNNEPFEVCGNIIDPNSNIQIYEEICESHQGCDSTVIIIPNYINYELQIDTIPNGNNFPCAVIMNEFENLPFDLFTNFYYGNNPDPFATDLATICDEGLYCIEVFDLDGDTYCNECFYWGTPPDTTNIIIAHCDSLCHNYLNFEFCEPIDTLFTFQNSMGGDSLVLLSIVDSGPMGFMDVTLCDGDCFFTGSGIFYCESGIYQDTFFNGSYIGCDSIVELNITILPPIFTEVNLYGCFGECFIFDGTELCVGDFATFIFTNYQGCDSVVNVSFNLFQGSLQIAPPDQLDCDSPNVEISGVDYSDVPNGEFIYSWNGPFILGPNDQPTVVVGEAGSYCLTVTHANGPFTCFEIQCVDVVTDNDEIPNPPFLDGDMNICEGDQAILSVSPNGNNIPTSYNWFSPNGTLDFINISQNVIEVYDIFGDVEICVTAENDCGTSDPTCILVWTNQVEAFISGDATICEGSGETADIAIEVFGEIPFQVYYSIDGEIQDPLINVFDNPYYLTVSEPGVYEIVSVEDGFGCLGLGQGEAEITAISAIEITAPIIMNNPTNTHYSVSFEILGGDQNSISIASQNGTLSGTDPVIFTSLPITCGTGFSFSVSDNGGCPPVIVEQMTHFCECDTEVGLMDETLIEVDDGNLAIGIYLGGEVLDSNDVLNFGLFEQPFNFPFSLAITPEFIFDPATMDYGKIYYMAALAGNEDSGGIIDVSDPCLAISNFVEVIFYANATGVPPPNSLMGNTNNESLDFGNEYQKDFSKEAEMNIKIFPNPATDQLFIHSNHEQLIQVELFDFNGKLVKQVVVNSLNYEMNLENLPAGVYLIKMKTASKVWMETVLKM